MARIFRNNTRKKTEESPDIWDGIHLADEFEQQTQNRIWDLLGKALIVFLLVSGTMGCYLSSLGVEYHPLVVYPVIGLFCVYAASLYYRKAWENIGYLLLFVVIVLAAAGLHTYINSGYYAVANDFAEEVSGFFDNNAMRSYGERVSNRALAVTISMSFIGVTASVVLNVLISRRMQYYLVLPVTAGILFLPLYMELEPDFLYVVMWLSGAFLSFAVRGGGHYQIQRSNQVWETDKQGHIRYVHSIRTVLQCMLMLLAVVILVSGVCTAFISKSKYHERHPAGTLKTRTMDTVENFMMFGLWSLMNFYDNTGGLSSGRLGGVNSVRLDYNPDLNLTFVPYTESRIYLRTYVGSDYEPFRNRWNRYQEPGTLTEKAYKKAYENDKTSGAKARMVLENIEAPAGVYLPYYSLDLDHYLITSRRQTYDYYPQVSQAEVPEEKWQNLKQWLNVPEENRETIRNIIREAGLSGEDVSGAVSRLAQYYQENIPYSYQPGATPHNKDFINYFLGENKKGYCAHFASAAVLILRELGIPARYCEGYALDSDEIAEEGKILYDENVSDYYDGYNPMPQKAVVSVDLTDANAHAWVEVYERGRGWQVADVTPAASTDEEPAVSLWSRLMGLFRGGGRTSGQHGERTDVRNTPKIVQRVSVRVASTAAVVFALAFLFHVVLRLALRRIRYHRMSDNDRLIERFTAKTGRLRRKYPDFAQCQNYREQIHYLAIHGKEAMDPEQEEQIIRILEQAGYSDKPVTAEEFSQIMAFLRKM